MQTKFDPSQRLAHSQPEVLRTMEIVWSAYRSVLSKEGGLAYVSMAITTGKRLYEVCRSLNIKSPDELKTLHPQILYSQILPANLESGNAVARAIAARDDHPVIAPSIFEARKQRWSQDEYMAMWLRLIEEHVTRMYMSPGWEFSNGGAEEFLHAITLAQGWRSRCNIEILDPTGKPILFHQGFQLMANALVQLHDWQLKAPTVANVFRTLCGMSFVQTDLTLYDLLPFDQNHTYLHAADFRAMRRTAASVETLLKEDYGLELHGFAFSGASGPEHTTEAIPESVVLKEVERAEEANSVASSTSSVAQ